MEIFLHKEMVPIALLTLLMLQIRKKTNNDKKSGDDKSGKTTTTTKTNTTTKIIKQDNKKQPGNKTKAKHNTGFPFAILVVAVFVGAFIPLNRRK